MQHPTPWLRALALVLALAAPAAQAHQASDAFLTLNIDGAQVEQRLDIALRDLDRDLDLDADGDGVLRWGELRARWPDIERLAADGVRIARAGQACERLATAAPQLVAHADGRHAVLRSTLRCATGAGPLTIDYRLFAQSDPTHRGLARFEQAAAASTVEATTLQATTVQATTVLVPGAAPVTLADGTADAAPHGFVGFFAEGLHHIAIGLDHVLFLVTLLLVAVWRRSPGTPGGWAPRESARSTWAEALRLVSAFTLSHSLTLALAATGVLAPPAAWVEPLIAASVLLAALDNLRPFLPGPRWLAVALFGLVHGFGFAGPLQDLGLTGTALALPLLAFNLGVEAGQLLLVLVLLPLALAARHAAAYRRWVVRPVSAGVALLALGWTLQRTWG